MKSAETLTEESCEACSAGAVRLSEPEISQLLVALPQWQVVELPADNQTQSNQARANALRREYPFKNFAAALAFTNQVGELAESVQHHPDILTAWGRVELVWYSHKIAGLHRNDFRCAARCDQLYSEIP